MKILKGMAAASGRAEGKIRIVLAMEDFKDLQAGEILVTNLKPDNITVIKRAKAIITETGGITSHIAKAARELKTPCVVDVKDATRILHDGDVVLVDGNKGIINYETK